jgi:hypothetical protein
MRIGTSKSVVVDRDIWLALGPTLRGYRYLVPLSIWEFIMGVFVGQTYRHVQLA